MISSCLCMRNREIEAYVLHRLKISMFSSQNIPKYMKLSLGWICDLFYFGYFILVPQFRKVEDMFQKSQVVSYAEVCFCTLSKRFFFQQIWFFLNRIFSHVWVNSFTRLSTNNVFQALTEDVNNYNITIKISIYINQFIWFLKAIKNCLKLSNCKNRNG